MKELMARAMDVAGPATQDETPLDEVLRQVQRSAAEFAALNDPNHAYALSMIETD